MHIQYTRKPPSAPGVDGAHMRPRSGRGRFGKGEEVCRGEGEGRHKTRDNHRSIIKGLYVAAEQGHLEVVKWLAG